MTETAKPQKPVRKRAPRRKVVEINQETIERRAYELWESGVEGDELAHWLRAEQELRAA